MRSMKTWGYILVTPAKNEEDNLPLLAKSIVNQTLKPKLWIIVNDNSTDRTSEIISSLESRHPWIVGHSMNDEFFEYDATMRYSEVVRTGFSVARRIAHESGVPYGYIGLVDADFILERRFFEKLIFRFHKNSRLGIASGGVYLKTPHGKRIYWERTNPNHPRGSPRLFRRKCFDDIGGYRRFYTPDVVSNYLARIKGWEVTQVIDAIALQLRPTQSRDGFFRAYIRQGRANYHLGVSPVSLLFRVLFVTLFDDPTKAAGLFVGYFAAYSKREPYLLPKRIREFAKEDMSVLNNMKKVLMMTGL
ncbi:MULTISPECIES: glycosyltransferase [unclassified Thermococcus]|uniref:glycosyltransferase family 2 protein n=1 Tax=unclassified Thermococcus TaxID=2627626 RepID=UPI00197F1A12|nr:MULTISPECIES: glycosyltransferase [unclassified Thermococcus]